MSGVAIVTDSASDLPSDEAAADGITIVPLYVSFGDEDFRSGVDLSTDDFWRRLTAPGAPFPKTAACSPGDFQAAFERLLAEGAGAIVCVTVGGRLSGTLKSAQIARDAMPNADIHVVDSMTASMGVALLAQLAAAMARDGAPAAAIAAGLEARRGDVHLFVALETLEYLRRGGRISGAQARIGTVLSVKPIITIEDGVVETADKPRTRSRARERVLELLAEKPVDKVAVLHGMAPDIDEFAAELARRTGVAPGDLSIHAIGPSVGPHVGPGAYGAVVLRRPA